MKVFRSKFTRILSGDLVLLGFSILLTSFGLILIYSATFGNEILSTKFIDQIIWLVVSLFVFFIIVLLTDTIFLERSAYPFFLIMLLLLLLTLFFGKEISGTKGWLSIFGRNLQASEIVKASFVLAISRFFSRNFHLVKKWQTLFFSSVYVIIPTTLILLQPDLGTAIELPCIWFLLVIFIGIRLRHLIVLSCIFLLLFLISYTFLLNDIQRERIQTFFDPSFDPKGAGYHIQQSKIAIGSGGLFGRGLGYGPQSQLNFLPEQHTDFIFAVGAEELGLLGVSVLLSVLFAFFYRGYQVLVSTESYFSFTLASSILILFFVQIFINLFMNLGLFPVAGVPFPFISYGGSSLLSSYLSIAFLSIISSSSLRSRSKIRVHENVF